MPSSQVFSKWKHHKLHSGSKTGPEVKSHAQAIAIMLSEKRAEAKHGGKYPERASGGYTDYLPIPSHNTAGATTQAQDGDPAFARMQSDLGHHRVAPLARQWNPSTGREGPMNITPSSLPMEKNFHGGGVAGRAMGGPMMGPGLAGPMGGTPGGMMPQMPMPMNNNVTQPPPPPMGLAGGREMPTTPRQLAPGGVATPGVGNFNMGKQANVNPSPIARSEERSVMRGPIMSSVPGRTDAHKTNVPSGSYVVPADIVSGRGQGNTAAGMNVLQSMFKMGPYGSPAGSMRPGRTMPRAMAPPKMQPMMARGGGKEGDHHHIGKPTPVHLAGGELVVPPENLMQVVHPNLKTAHEIMDKWVLKERAKLRKTLGKLPPPVKD